MGKRPRPAADTGVLLAAVAMAIAAAWLFMVTAVVLPEHDPRSIPFWTVVAVGFLACVGLAVFYLRPGGRSVAFRSVIVTASVCAVIVGAYWVAIALTRTDFEGYIVLLGLILAGFGGSVIVDEMSKVRAT